MTFLKLLILINCRYCIQSYLVLQLQMGSLIPSYLFVLFYKLFQLLGTVLIFLPLSGSLRSS